MDGPKADIDLDEVVAHFRRVVGFKVRRSIGPDNPDWEDLTNEVLAQTIAKVKSGEFRGESKIGTFIYTITARRIVDYIREKTKIARRFPAEAEPPEAADRLEKEERAKHLAAAVASLPGKYRQVLDLYYYQELSREETARRLGLTPARVSERVHYAQKLLRKSLDRTALPLSGAPSDSRKD
ncbi:MAG: sigma-70 family RNA polymerase sigma factor [Candidatus Aminicenantes bacterium]|nr:sigma-70 family RNA polymerase sigma factor [Candidatus Aminicenantes bacterium]